MGRVKMSKGTSLKDAVAAWEKKNETKASESDQIVLSGIMPPIEKMDATLTTLAHCTKLSLSSNCIEKIGNLGGLKNLKILCLARNNIKMLNGVDGVGDTLEELWISYNNIEKLKGIHVLKKLRVLYMSNNNVKDWGEFSKLADLPVLQELVFNGNPLEEKMVADGDYLDKVKDKIKSLKKLDSTPIVREEDDDEE